MAGRIESSGRQASEDLMARAEECCRSGIKSHVEDAERSLTNLVVNTSETIQTGARTAQQALLTVSSDVGAQLKLTSAEVEARPHRRRHRCGDFDPDQRPRCADDAGDGLLRGRQPDQIAAADVERTLSAAGDATAASILAGAREAQTTLVTASADAANHVKSLAADVERSLSIAGTSTAEASPPAPAKPRARWSPPPPRPPPRSSRSPPTSSVRCRSPEPRPPRRSPQAPASPEHPHQRVRRRVEPGQVARRRRAAFAVDGRQCHRRVDHDRRARSPEHADHRVDDAANHVKSLAIDVERTLTAVGADTAASILGSAREAQSSLHATSADAASQIKAISADIERSLGVVTANTTDTIQTSALNAQSALVAASNEVSSKVKSTSADIERSVLAASGTFGSTMTGKTDEIVTYVQQQTDRLSQMIDGKRGSLVEAHRRQDHQLTIDIDRVTADALKSIETRGQAFSQSMLSHGSDVARTITSAGELATGAVNKSLKDLEQSSRAAIDQSRQVSIAAVTEMQETSKILRTDTVALFERLREGNILLQEVLTGAHDNLNSLERALVTRVADFVSAMNDVTSRNGVATQTLEDQLTVFNSQDLEGAGGSRRAVRASSSSTARRWSRPRPWSNRATAPPPPRSPSASRAGIAGHHHRSAHHRSRSAAVALHRPARRIAGGGRRARPRYRARGGGNRRRRLGRDQPPVRGGARRGRRRAPADRSTR